MDVRFVNAVARSVSEFLPRRAMMRGLAAAVGIVALGPAASGAKKGRRKNKRARCNRCPERRCCMCFGLTEPVACRYVETTAECDEFCEGSPGGRGLITGQAGFSAFCTTGNDCVVVECPVVPK